MKKLLLTIFIAFNSSLFTFCEGQFTVLHDFNDTAGGFPQGSLTLSGNVLFGMTSGGGGSDGNIFSIHTDGSAYKDIFDFYGTYGLHPYGSLALSGNKLYGMTNDGGIWPNGYGCIFSIDTSGGNYKKLLNFNDTNGANPHGSLTLSGNILYGMTYNGGKNDSGCVFSIDTSGKNYKDLFDFKGTTGYSPNGSLLLLRDRLYGMTEYGGLHGYGVIFSIDTFGNGYKDLFDFNGANGANPQGSLALSTNKLYGMTEDGGTNNYGCIFSIDTNGAGYRDMLNIADTMGAYPHGDLTIRGNTMYGMTQYNIFSIDTDGSNYIDMYYGVQYPFGDLTFSGNALYGMSSNGGIYVYPGYIFEIDTNSRASINELAANTGSINVYPNPSNGVFTFTLSHPELVSGAQTIEVYNVLGGKVYSQYSIPTAQYTLNLSNQPNGVYLYRVITNSGELIGEGKLIIQK